MIIRRYCGFGNLSGKIVLITGASAGLGKELSTRFYKNGCTVIMTGRKLQALNEAREKILAQFNLNNEIITFEFDIGDLDHLPNHVKQLVHHISSSLSISTIDILVNNAGISQRSDFSETPLDAHSKIFNVNYLGPVYLTKLLLSHLLRSTSPLLVNICSVQSWIAVPGRSAYSASKFALRGFSDSIRREIGNQLRVLSVHPGYIKTNIHLNAMTKDGCSVQESVSKEVFVEPTNGLSVEYVADKILHSITNSNEADLMIYSDYLQPLAVILSYFCPSVLNWYFQKKHDKNLKTQ